MLKLCTSNKGLVWFTSSKIKICPTQNQMEPEANAFERCFALIRVLDIFQLPEVIFLEAANHQSNQVGRFICLLLCQCTSVNCPLSKGCWSGNYRWSIYFAQYCCLTLWKYVCQWYRRNTHQHQRVSKQKIPIIILISDTETVTLSTLMGQMVIKMAANDKTMKTNEDNDWWWC